MLAHLFEMCTKYFRVKIMRRRFDSFSVILRRRESWKESTFSKCLCTFNCKWKNSLIGKTLWKVSLFYGRPYLLCKQFRKKLLLSLSVASWWRPMTSSTEWRVITSTIFYSLHLILGKWFERTELESQIREPVWPSWETFKCRPSEQIGLNYCMIILVKLGIVTKLKHLNVAQVSQYCQSTTLKCCLVLFL